ncbi:LuxR family transcriptional regulator [Nitrospira sp. Kam-Ns4a]
MAGHADLSRRLPAGSGSSGDGPEGAVLAGPPQPSAPSVRQAPVLTKREREVLEWMKEGKTNWEIGRILGISERTVRFHVGNILCASYPLRRQARETGSHAPS